MLLCYHSLVNSLAKCSTTKQQKNKLLITIVIYITKLPYCTKLQMKSNAWISYLWIDLYHLLSVFQARGGPQRYTVSTWLQIQGLHLSDAGVYSCISHNALGETSASAQLTVFRQGESLSITLQTVHCGELRLLSCIFEICCIFLLKVFLSALQGWRRWEAALRRNRSTLIIWRRAAVMGSWHLEITRD